LPVTNEELTRARKRRVDDVAALRAVYQEYANALYDYCLRATGDPDHAEDGVHATLIAALGHPGLLWDNRRLRAWLFAAARNECLRAKNRDGAAALPATDHNVEAAELAARYKLTIAEIGIVLGRTKRTATVHVPATPQTPAPEALYSRVLTSARVPERLAYFTERVQPLSRAGYPVPLDKPQSRRALYLMAGVTLVLIALLTALLTQDPERDSVEVDAPSSYELATPAPKPTSSPTQTPSLSITTPAPSKPSPRRTPTTRPKPPSPKPSRAPQGPSGATPTVTMRMNGVTACMRDGTWAMRVFVTTSGVATKSAEVTWWTESRQPTSVTARRTGENTYEADLIGLPPSTPIGYRASAVSVGGRTGQSGASAISRACR
jgi:hypothetical protein